MAASKVERAKTGKGFSLVEVLIAALVIAVGLAAVVSLWTTSFTQIEEARRQEVAAQLARHDLEKAKVQGFWNLPLGTLANVGGYQVGIWTGPIEYYDRSGNPLDFGDPEAARCFSLQRVVTDYSVAPAKESTQYILLFNSKRIARTVVRSYSNGELRADMGMCLVRGGV